jgi:hypothetical protein
VTTSDDAGSNKIAVFDNRSHQVLSCRRDGPPPLSVVLPVSSLYTCGSSGLSLQPSTFCPLVIDLLCTFVIIFYQKLC